MAASPWYRHRLRVRYQETDQMGVVYHVNYANWFEIGRTELIRSLGMPYRKLEELGLLLPVTELEVKFRKPARYDDLVSIYTRIVSFSAVQLQIESQVRMDTVVEVSAVREAVADADQAADDEPQGDLLVYGGTKHVWLDRDWRMVRIDKAAPQLYTLLRGSMDGGSA